MRGEAGRDWGHQPVRVAQVVRPAAGGIRRHVSLLTAHLDRQRFAPSVYAPADFTLDTPSLNAPSLNAPALTVPQHQVDITARTDIVADLRAIHDLTRRLRGHADVVHAHGLRAALIGVFAAGRVGIPCLFTAHNLLPPPGRLQRLLLRRIGRLTNAIVAVSQAVAETLIEAGLPAAKIHVIPNGIDLAPFDAPLPSPAVVDLGRPLSVPHNAPLIVAVGRLSPEKGFDILIRAFVEVYRQMPDAHLIIVGSGPEAEGLQALADGANLKERVHFPGRADDIIPILRAADIVAVPSRMEGQGLVALEAMAARRAVIASRVGGLAESIVEGRTGLLVPPNDPPAFANALVQLLRDPSRRLEMGLRGRRRVEQLYTVERMILNIQDVYASLAK